MELRNDCVGLNQNRLFSFHALAGVLRCIPIILGLMMAAIAGNAYAQESKIPNFWDPHERFIKSVDKTVGSIKFITTTDFPPFSFVDGEKRVVGFNVDLARAICAELGKLNSCQLQALPWSEQENAISQQKGVALISGLSISRATRKKFAFTRPYLDLPARFVSRKSNSFDEPLYHNLSEKIVGVVSGTAHEAFLVANFGKSRLQVFLNQNDAFKALREKKIDVMFTDALSASFWLQSQQAADCCRFVGGPYRAPEYFGRGLAIAVQPQDKGLLNALNFALRSINDKGIFSELYLRYFPVSIY